MRQATGRVATGRVRRATGTVATVDVATSHRLCGAECSGPPASGINFFLVNPMPFMIPGFTSIDISLQWRRRDLEPLGRADAAI